MEDIISFITCPINRSIFRYPVVAEDGTTYEKDAITDWLKENNTSPLTKKIIGTTLRDNNLVKSITTDFLEKNPSYQSEQYEEIKLDHTDNQQIVKDILRRKNYPNLLKIHKFDMNLFDIQFYNDFIHRICFDIQKYIMDNILSWSDSKPFIRYILENAELALVQRIIETSNPDPVWIQEMICSIIKQSRLSVVNYMINKFDFDPKHISPDSIKSHYERPSSLELIKTFISKNIINTESIVSILFTIFRFQTSEIINYIVSKMEIEWDKMPLEEITIAYFTNERDVSSIETVINLVEHSILKDVVISDGKKPVHRLCMYPVHNADIIIYLINQGFDVNARTNNGNAAMQIACSSAPLPDIIDVLKVLINATNLDNLNSAGSFNHAPICHICETRSLELLRLMVDKGVDINKPLCNVNSGSYPIHRALALQRIKDDTSYVKYLIDNADLEVQDTLGRRPVHIACMNKNVEILKFLIYKGVDINTRTNDGKTPLDILSDEATRECIHVLLNAPNLDNL
jgi:ankyrin repeat protein